MPRRNAGRSAASCGSSAARLSRSTSNSTDSGALAIRLVKRRCRRSVLAIAVACTNRSTSALARGAEVSAPCASITPRRNVGHALVRPTDSHTTWTRTGSGRGRVGGSPPGSTGGGSGGGGGGNSPPEMASISGSSTACAGRGVRAWAAVGTSSSVASAARARSRPRPLVGACVLLGIPRPPRDRECRTSRGAALTCCPGGRCGRRWCAPSTRAR
jgi:hypothetical protein